MRHVFPMILGWCCAFAQAQDPKLDTTDTASPLVQDTQQVQSEMRDLAETAVEQAEEVKELEDDIEVIKRFLEDAKRVKDGKVPEGWEQPAMDEYAKAGSPYSLVPGVTPPEAPVIPEPPPVAEEAKDETPIPEPHVDTGEIVGPFEE